MSESPAKIRLVRCPKCENLLPEVTDYAVYQCGGCGAVLRAENKHMDSSMSSEKSCDESDVISKKITKESVNVDFSNRSMNNMNLGSENGVKSNGSSGRRPEKDNFDEPNPVFVNNKNGSRRSVQGSNYRYHQTNVQEGSSSYHYAELVQDPNDLEIDDDRAELLRKLDELKYEIVRSRDKSQEKVPVHHHNIPSYMHLKSNSLVATSNQVQVFSDPFRSHNHRRNPILPFEQHAYHPYYSGQYVSNEVTDNRLFHHPSCSCLVCYNKHQQAPPLPPPPPQQPPPPIASPVLPNDPIFYQHDYNHRFSNLSLNSHNSEPRSRWSKEIRRPPRGILAPGVRRCHPVAGGSPFVSCCNCYELLQVPKKNTKKMRCASCSEVMLLAIVNKRLVLSVFEETNKDYEKLKDDHKTHGHSKWGGTEFSSEDYDNSGNFDFESMDKLQLGGSGLTSYKSGVSYASEDEIKVNIILDDNPVDAAVYANKPSPPPSGSPLQDHFDYSTEYNRAGKGNVSRRSEIERVEKPVNSRSHVNSMKDAAVASEIDISSNEYCVNTGTSQESGDTSRDMGQQRGNGSFFVGMIKKSFSRSGQHVDDGNVNVMVNGHPIPDRLVKKAEKLAGPIQPGDYWYDPRAGFWGMMGGPCRGIIPPFIEEFNHPMPKKCADGNTNVFVNGRELHQKDLDLLACRGLPSETDRSYVIEISGRVLDEDSGFELESLGKLAPT
ncbi:hypothetical protein R6Q57_015449 [Mikania cordata]